MATQYEPATQVSKPGGLWSLLRPLSRVPPIFLALLALIWVGLPAVPPETGLRFGLGFQLFFTATLGLSTLFFWFLGLERIPSPKSAAGVLASVAGVYLAAVGLVVIVATLSPQFGLPSSQGAAEGAQAEERGKALFLRDDVGCFRCHMVAGTGGTRGPDLTQVGARAGGRVSGLSAEQYMREKIKSGATFRFTVPEYVPIMPAFGQTLNEEQVADLVAYLLSLR